MLNDLGLLQQPCDIGVARVEPRKVLYYGLPPELPPLLSVPDLKFLHPSLESILELLEIPILFTQRDSRKCFEGIVKSRNLRETYLQILKNIDSLRAEVFEKQVWRIRIGLACIDSSSTSMGPVEPRINPFETVSCASVRTPTHLPTFFPQATLS